MFDSGRASLSPNGMKSNVDLLSELSLRMSPIRPNSETTKDNTINTLIEEKGVDMVPATSFHRKDQILANLRLVQEATLCYVKTIAPDEDFDNELNYFTTKFMKQIAAKQLSNSKLY